MITIVITLILFFVLIIIVIEKIWFAIKWEDIADASQLKFYSLKNKKGIYIIKNKTKNKYYVGQSKNIARRLNQHFCNGVPKNEIFKEDWKKGDVFVFYYIECRTKNKLDKLERKYIKKYDSFRNGYNSTQGNL